MERDRCEDGALFEFGDATLRIASFYSRRHQLARSAVERAVRVREQEKNPFTADELHHMECALVAETILLGWENVTEHDVPLDPTPENRARLLYEAPPFLVAVKNLSRDFAPYSLLGDEGARKNSKGSSPGGSGGDPNSGDGSNPSREAA